MSTIIRTQEEISLILEEYKNRVPRKQLKSKYHISYEVLNRLVAGLPTPSNMRNLYTIEESVATIYVKRKNGEIYTTLVDVEDLYKLLDNSRTITVSKINNVIVFKFDLPKQNGKKKSMLIHRFIMNAPEGFDVDHINHNTADNRKCNLRVVTRAENQQNKNGAVVNSKTGIRGVSWHTKGNKWRARFTKNGQEFHLGLFDSIDLAENAVILARRKHMPFSEMDKL